MEVVRPFLLLVTVAATAWGGEYAVLTSGARLRADRHEILASGWVRLYSHGGTLEFPASQVVAFEPEEQVPAAPQDDVKAPPAPTPQALANAAAKDYGLPPELVRSVMAAESAFDPQAVSPKGATGLMQLMPGTAKMYGADPKNPEQNVNAGTQYLRELLLKYNGDTARALAAYNAGPGVVDKYNGVPPYRETRGYVDRVVRKFQKAREAEQ